jgi:hypothetical protein
MPPPETRTARVPGRSTPGNAENAPLSDISATLARHANVSIVEFRGNRTISRVSPPPFFRCAARRLGDVDPGDGHGFLFRTQSIFKKIFTTGFESPQDCPNAHTASVRTIAGERSASRDGFGHIG